MVFLGQASSRVVPLKIVGVGMVLTILLDVTVIRILLAPARGLAAIHRVDVAAATRIRGRKNRSVGGGQGAAEGAPVGER